MLDNEVVQQIDVLLAEYHDYGEQFKRGDFGDTARQHFLQIKTRLKAAIDRLSFADSEYRRSAAEVLQGAAAKVAGGGSPATLNSPIHQSQLLAAILAALRSDYAAGYMRTISELIHADLFSDFLEMAQHLLSEGYKDPAAVLGGSTLEEHLRKLCEKNGLSVADASGKPLKADKLNADLKAANVYSGL